MKILTRRIGPLFVLLGLAAAGVAFFGTSVAPWAYSDGVGYLVSARNLVEGPGLGLVKPSGQFEPLVTHPPLYPLLLASGRALGLDVVTAARWIGLLSFGLLVGFAGWLTVKITNRVRAGLSVSLLLLVSPPLVLLFLAAMAEPLFLLTGVLSLLLLALGLRTESRFQLALSAILAGASALSRYPGLVFVLTGAVVLLLQPTGLRQRLRESVQFTSIGGAPVAAFLVVSSSLRQAGAPRWLAAEGFQLGDLTSFIRQAVTVFWSWKPVPTEAVLSALGASAVVSTRFVALLVAAFLALGLLGYLWANRSRVRTDNALVSPASPLVVVCGAFAALYLGFLLAAFLLTSPTPDVDFRTVLPVLPAILIGGVAWLNGLVPESASEPFRTKAFYALLITSLLVGYLPTTVELLIGHHRTGAGYTAQVWRRSELVRAVRSLPSSQPLISNAPEGFLLHAGRYPHNLAGLASEGQEDCLGQGSSSLDTLFRDEGAALVLVSGQLEGTELQGGIAPHGNFELMPCAAHVLYAGSDGVLLVYPGVLR